MAFGISAGAIFFYADATHNEILLGANGSFLSQDNDLVSGPSRIVAAGLWMWSM